MNCSSCGSQIADGTVICPNCGAENQPQAAAAPVYDQAQYQQPVQQMQAAPKKKTGLIVGIIAAIAVIAIIVAVLVIFVFGKKKSDVDGTYVCNDYAAFGMTVEITLDGDEFTMVMSMTYEGQTESETESGTFEVDGDEIKLTSNGTTITGTIDGDTINVEGMVFKKK